MELPETWIPELHEYCRENDILFLTTPFDTNSVNLLMDYVPAYKIASYTLSHHPFLKHVANTGKPVIMSTGAHSLDEVREAVSVLRTAGVSDLVLLQCVASYPTPLDSINVRAIERLRKEFGTHVGLSDHTTDPTIAPAATVALGGVVVEKHFTLDRSMEGPDHSFALEPDELDQMVTAIRRTESALGRAEKRIIDVEQELQQMAKRGIQAARDIDPGERIGEDEVAILRPGERDRGIRPKYYSDVLNATAVTKIKKDEGINWSDLDIEKPE
jgi:N-acetylneuraminate synthase